MCASRGAWAGPDTSARAAANAARGVLDDRDSAVAGAAGPSRRRDPQQRVGDLAHRRHDDHRPAAVARARGPDDLDQTSDGFWIGDRRAAEFLNNHVLVVGGWWLVGYRLQPVPTKHYEPPNHYY